MVKPRTEADEVDLIDILARNEKPAELARWVLRQAYLRAAQKRPVGEVYLDRGGIYRKGRTLRLMPNEVVPVISALCAFGAIVLVGPFSEVRMTTLGFEFVKQSLNSSRDFLGEDI